MSEILPFYQLKIVDSTQLELKRMLRQQGELDSFTTLLAEHQTAGRGRGVSKWHDSPGSSLLLSIYVNWPVPLKESFEVNQRVCVALKPIFPDSVLFKWPNDLMVGTKKLGGMLIENHWSGGGIKSSSIGIGINLNPTNDALTRAAFLNECTSNTETPLSLAKRIQRQFSEALTSPYTTSQLVRAYHDILWGQLEPQPYLINGKEVMATVEGVTENGRLALRFENKVMDTFDIDQIKWVDPN